MLIQEEMVRALEKRQKTLTGAGRDEKETEIIVRMNTLFDMEKQLIYRVLERTNFNKTEAANILGLSRQALYKKMQKYYENNPD